ncbi:hypothetical protein FRC20_005659 [Serendipita sp. 405]|nr:hypothetical protein FRC20_005659 [Serendipita sp. 405]
MGTYNSAPIDHFPLRVEGAEWQQFLPPTPPWPFGIQDAAQPACAPYNPTSTRIPVAPILASQKSTTVQQI